MHLGFLFWVVLFCFVFDMGSCSSGWLPTHHAAKDGLECWSSCLRFLRTRLWGWTVDSRVVKTTVLTEDPVPVQHPHGSSSLSVSPVLGIGHLHRQNTYIHKTRACKRELRLQVWPTEPGFGFPLCFFSRLLLSAWSVSWSSVLMPRLYFNFPQNLWAY